MRGIDKHKFRQRKQVLGEHLADVSLSALLNRCASGGEFVVPSTREARAALRKAAHAKRKAGEP